MRRFLAVSALLFGLVLASEAFAQGGFGSRTLANGGTMTGDLTMSSGTQIFLPDGSASDPALAASNATDMGISFGVSPANLNFSVGGSRQFFITNSAFRSNNGNGPVLQDAGATATAPVIVTNRDTSDGLGHDGTDPYMISDGSSVVQYAAEASAVNHLKVTASATGNFVDLETVGSDSSVPLRISTKGSQQILLRTGTTNRVQLTGSTSQFKDETGSVGVEVLDDSGTQKIGFFGVTAVAQQSAMTAANGSTVDATYGTEERDVIQNNVTRIQELENMVENLGLAASN